MVDNTEKARVFLSYSRVDEAAIIALAELLEKEGEIEVFRDKEDILPAEDWRDRLKALIIGADAIVYCLTPDSARSEVAAWEVETAERLSKRIVPVVLRPTEGSVPEPVARLNYIFLTDLLTDAAVREEGLARLRTAIKTDIDWIRQHTRIGELAQRWAADGRRNTDLLRGGALEAAENWLAQQPRHAPPPTTLQHEFIGASRRSATLRQRWWVTGSLLVAAMAIGLSLLAYWQRGIAVEQRTQANARRLAAEAQVVLANPLAAPELAVRDLLISLSLAPSAAATEALATGVSRLAPRPLGHLPWPADAGGPRTLTFSPDGAWLAAATPKEALFWEVGARRLALRIPLPEIEGSVDFAFTDEGACALVSLRADPEPGAAGSWAVVDLEAATIETLTSNEALDVTVAGDRILALKEATEGDGLAVVELPGGTPVLTPETTGRVIFGRFFEIEADPSKQPMPMIEMMPMIPQPVSSAPRRMQVVIAEGGGVAVWDIREGRRVLDKPLPEGAVPLDVGGVTGVLAIRRPQDGDAVISLTSGETIWQAPHLSARFRGFAGGDRFIVVEDGLATRFLSLDDGFSVRAEHDRRTDYDIGALYEIARYTPIISVEVARSGGQVVTAWKDGRVAVWEAGQKPRYGGFGAMPMPNFEAVARFDHGQTLGATAPLWTAPPALYVAPTGRYVASQSLGIETNPVGGIIAFDPLVRIWDTRRGGEIARFRPGAPMVVAFAPSEDLLATVIAAPPDKTGSDGGALRLELWDLTEPSVRIEETREAVTLPLTPPPPKADTQRTRQSAARIATLPRRLPAPIWVGTDLGLRALDAETGEIVLVEDFAPVVSEVFARLRTRVEELHETLPADALGALEGSVVAEDALRKMQAGFEGLPAELPAPFLPIAVSADGRRALVGVGTTLRLYALDGRPRHLRTFELGGTESSFLALATANLLLSRDGSAFAAGIMTLPFGDTEQRMLKLEGLSRSVEFPEMPVRLLVFHANAEAPVQQLTQRFIFMPPTPVGRLLERAVALAPNGRRLVLEVTTISPSEIAAPGITARLVVRDLVRGEEVLALPPRRLIMNPFGSWEVDGGSSPVAAFDATGEQLLVLREAPDCPLKVVVHPMTFMPLSLPGCAERRITLTLWDLTSGERLGKIGFVAPGTKAKNELLEGAQFLNVGTVTPFAALPSPQVALDLLEGGIAELRVIEANFDLESAIPKLELVRIRRQVALGQENPLIRTACQRLPGEIATIGKEAWANHLPGEAYRPICTPAVTGASTE